MCDPVSLFVASAAISGGSSLYEGFNSSRTHKRNADLLDYQRDVRLAKGRFDVATSEREYLRQRGKVEASIAASGFTQESFFAILADDAQEAGLERDAIAFNARQDAFLLEERARSERSSADSAIISGFIGAASSAVSGGSNITQHRQSTGSSGASVDGPFIK